MIMSFGPAFQAKDDQLGKWTVQIADWLDELGDSSNEPSPWSAHSACANLSQRVKSMIDAVVWAKLGKQEKRMSFQQKRQALLHGVRRCVPKPMQEAILEFPRCVWYHDNIISFLPALHVMT